MINLRLLEFPQEEPSETSDMIETLNTYAARQVIKAITNQTSFADAVHMFEQADVECRVWDRPKIAK